MFNSIEFLLFLSIGLAMLAVIPEPVGLSMRRFAPLAGSDGFKKKITLSS